MYNRYIPRDDGSYHRNRVPDPSPPAPPAAVPTPASAETAPQPHRSHSGSAGGFLKALLPKEFDTGDLLVVLLILLMAERKTEDQNTALLTLALYFLM